MDHAVAATPVLCALAKGKIKTQDFRFGNYIPRMEGFGFLKLKAIFGGGETSLT